MKPEDSKLKPGDLISCAYGGGDMYLYHDMLHGDEGFSVRNIMKGDLVSIIAMPHMPIGFAPVMYVIHHRSGNRGWWIGRPLSQSRWGLVK